MSDTKEKKVKTPRQPDSIFKGALALPLEKRVELRDQLTDSIVAEVEALEQIADNAKRIAAGGKQ